MESNKKEIKVDLDENADILQKLIATNKKLEESEERFKLAMKASNDGLFDWNLETNDIYYSISWKKMLGYEDHELPNDFSVWEKTTDPKDVKKSWELQQKLITKEIDRFVLEFKMKHKDGHWVDILSRAEAIFNDNGEAIRIVGTHVDISERKRAEQQILKNEGRLDYSLTSIETGAWELDLRTLGAWRSLKHDQIFGYEELLPEWTFEMFLEHVIPEDRAEVKAKFEKAIATKTDWNFECQIVKKDGIIRWILAKGNHEFNEYKESVKMFGIVQDITDRKLAEIKLKDSQNYLSAIFNNTQDSQLLSKYEGDKKFRIVAVNNSYLKTVNQFGLNVTEKDLIGKSLKEGLLDILFLAPEVFDYTVRFYQKAIDTKEQVNYTESFILNEKSYHSETSYTPIFNSEDGQNYILYNSHDITKETESINLLKGSEEKYRLAMDATTDGLWDWDVQTGEVYFNPSYSRILGELDIPHVYESWGNRVHPNDKDTALQSLHDHLNGKTNSWQQEHRLLTKSGEWVWVLGRGRVVKRDKDGKAMRMVGTMADITERKKAVLLLQKQTEQIETQNEELNKKNEELNIAKERAEKSEEMFKEYYNLSPNGIFVVDINEENEYVFNSNNPMSEKIIGFKNNEIAGRGINVLLEKYDIDIVNYVTDLYDKVVDSQEPLTLYEELVLLGKKVNLSTTIKPLVDENGKVYRLLGTNVDISKLKQTESELTIAKENAEESDRLKSAFLSNMSHEIRTPMNGILGFTGLLKEPDLTIDQQNRYINIIEKSGARMLNIINDIIDISKIEAGLMKVDLRESNVNEQIEYIYTFFRPEAEVKGITLSFSYTLPSQEAIIKTDREKLFAILTNLVKNAVKYTNEGTIKIGYNRMEDMLEFYIKDTGIGIPENRLDAIFERFIQADIDDEMARHGVGLGLSITKSYVEMLGGTIWVESEEGIGSSFYFTLPYHREIDIENELSLKEETNQDYLNDLGLNVLIAEDDEISEAYITIAVEKISDNILKARTGIEAIELCRNNPDIDLILMDIKMPVLNGYETTKQIRLFNKEVIIIAQTAYGLSNDREKALDSGCNDYIAKPINKNELLLLIHRYFKQ